MKPHIRWAVRGTLILGVAASVAANVLHARDNPISQAIAAWPPLALLITVEVVARVPIIRRWLGLVRVLGVAVIAGIAAWVSYWHMAGVAQRYGEATGAAHLLPLSVDGLIVVASVCLVELGARTRDTESAPVVRSPVPAVVRPLFDHASPIGPMPAPVEVDRVSTVPGRERKPQPSSRERVEKAHRRSPAATNDQLAQRLSLSTKTVARYRPERAAEETQEAKVNGKVPDLEGASR